MAPTVTRLILSFALVIATPTLLFIVMFLGYEVLEDMLGFRGLDDDIFFICSSLGCVVFFGLGWWLVWRGEVRWTSGRSGKTWAVLCISFLISMCVAIGSALAVPYEGELIGSILGGLVWIVLWLFGTAWAWRETSAERAGRLAAMGVEALPCPSCSYNLSGLRESKCPECGAAFILDQLYAAVDEQRRPMAQG